MGTRDWSQELIDSTIDYLGDDRTSMKACSLLSSQWVPRSRSYLFSTLKIDAPSSTNASRYKSLVSILGSPRCTFLSSVQHLELHGTASITFEKPDAKPHDVEWLKPIINTPWTSVKSLTLERIDSYTRQSEAWKQFISTSSSSSRFHQNITNLTISHFAITNSVEDATSFLSVIPAFPSVQTLKLDPFTAASTWAESDTPKSGSAHGPRPSGPDDAQVQGLVQKLGAPPIDLRSLTITGQWVFCPFPLRILWEWFRLNKVTRVQSLDLRLDFMEPGDLPSFGRYLETLGPKVKELKCVMGHGGRDFESNLGPGELGDARCVLYQLLRPLVDEKILSKLTGIEEATFECIFFFDLAHKHPMSLAKPDRFFSSLSGKSLKRLNVSVWTDLANARWSDDEDAPEEETAWFNADAILTNVDMFPVLEKLVITVTIVRDINFDYEWDPEPGEIDAEEISEMHIAQFMRKYLPKCQAKGILEFEHVAWDDVPKARFGIFDN